MDKTATESLHSEMPRRAYIKMLLHRQLFLIIKEIADEQMKMLDDEWRFQDLQNK